MNEHHNDYMTRYDDDIPLDYIMFGLLYGVFVLFVLGVGGMIVIVIMRGAI